MSPREQLEEPLLSPDETNAEQGLIEVEPTPANSVDGDNDDGGDCPNDDAVIEESVFSVRGEIWEMISLGFPLAVSFFCRMGMASTDSSFVGHINDGVHTAETYLAAAVLSDMCVNVFITPPLAFNRVLNALVGQAMGSGNPKMAGIWLQQSMFWLSITMIPFLALCFYVEPILLLLDFPQDVAQVAGTYAKFNIVWPIPNGLYQCMRFYFQAQGLPRPAMYNNIVFLFVNALLNWIFVFGGPFSNWNGLGFIGAAISLSFSRTLQPFFYYLYMFMYKEHHKNTWPDDGWSFKHHTKDRTMEFMKQSVPNIGTFLFQTCASQATTVLVGRLGEQAIAASSALSTVSIPWSGTMSATCDTISGVRVGYHLGRGDANAARKSAWMVMHFITVTMIFVAIIFLPLRHYILDIATNDDHVLSLAAVLVPAMLVGSYLNLLVDNITSGIFSGMGRPIIATILSFGFELPTSIGGVAIYILLLHGNLIGVYWWQAISGGIELVVVWLILISSDWGHWAAEARRRQEAPSGSNSENNDDTETAPIITDVESSSGILPVTEDTVNDNPPESVQV